MKNSQKCSQCDTAVGEENIKYKNYLETLEFLFPTVEAGDDVYQSADVSTSHIVVTTLSGECTTLVFNPNQTIMSVKDFVEKELNIPANKQSLLYNNIELKVCMPIISSFFASRWYFSLKISENKAWSTKTYVENSDFS